MGVIGFTVAKAIKSLSDKCLSYLLYLLIYLKLKFVHLEKKYRIDWYEDYHDLFDRRSDVDAVCICTSSEPMLR